MSIPKNTQTRITSEEARQIHGISKPTFKKWLDKVKPERERIPGKKGYYYDKNDMIFLKVAYLLVLADEETKKIRQLQEV